jgi:hypothetical protein
MRVLVACEFSGIVRDAFAKRGHDAWSCDLLDTEVPGNHIKQDVRLIIKEKWDLMIAHPPCTYLSSSGLHRNKRVPGRDELTNQSMIFVLNLLEAPIPRIALENPVGCISTKYRKPDQIIQPWQFGEDASKKTCLWLKGLPKLQPTKLVDPSYGCSCGFIFPYSLGKYGCPNCLGEGVVKHVWGNQTASGQNKLTPSENRWKDRSRTYIGIAAAMANQWGLEI